MGIQLCELDCLCTFNEDSKTAGIFKVPRDNYFVLLSGKGQDESSKAKQLFSISKNSF